MKIDDQLVTLCEEFADLEESEKDYILGISRFLIHLISVKDDSTQKVNDNQNIHFFTNIRSKEYLA